MGVLSTMRLGTKKPLRVAAYCRVSTDEEVQKNSYENQQEFYLKEIHEHPDWILVSIYGDRARSGTSTETRTGFQRMMRHAEAGTIDYILTKSISRFSRSTTDTIMSLQKLRTLGIGVYFMEESIDSMSNIGHIIIDTLATIAEMESHSISENIKVSMDEGNKQGWPLRKPAYGYEKNGKYWEVNSDRAFRIKLAFLMVCEGYAMAEIAEYLNQFEKKDNTGRVWNCDLLRYALKNEAYIGDIVTNKALIVWDGTKKKEVRNDRLVDQYYISSHHEPLVSAEVFEQVNDMLAAKRLAGQRCFTGMESLLELKVLARRDRYLGSVRKYLPSRKGKYMSL